MSKPRGEAPGGPIGATGCSGEPHCAGSMFRIVLFGGLNKRCPYCASAATIGPSGLITIPELLFFAKSQPFNFLERVILHHVLVPLLLTVRLQRQTDAISLVVAVLTHLEVVPRDR